MQCELQLTRISEIVEVERLTFCVYVFEQNTVTYLPSLLRNSKCCILSSTIAYMDSPLSLTQCPQSFHPDFNREVYMIVFSVSNFPYGHADTNVSSRSRVKDLRSMQAD